jgi:hypothetical protein
MAHNNVTRLATDAVGSASIDYPPKFSNIAVASSGDNTLVTGVALKKIRVVSLFLIASGTVNAYFVDGGNTDLAGDTTNKIALVANSGFSLPFNPVGWFETTVGDSLDVNLSGAVAVAGSLTYIEV